jgi:polysaccharide pyruvyl transferase WcaK-like protein
MYYIGIGGQDPLAYQDPVILSIIKQAAAIWVRDEYTYKALLGISLNHSKLTKIQLGSDLAHLLFEKTPFPKGQHKRINVTLNFDNGNWDKLNSVTKSLAQLNLNEHNWLIQEVRPLPGSEQWLFNNLSALEKSRWILKIADLPRKPLSEIISAWPSAELTLTSRFHATLAAAWSGSKTVTFAINDKLRSVSEEFGFEALSPSSSPDEVIQALTQAKPANPAVLKAKAALARQSVTEFLATLGLNS